MSESLYRATLRVTDADLPGMVLSEDGLPVELGGFRLSRDGFLDNQAMAAQGFPGSTTGDILATGRITGYLREFATPVQPELLGEGSEVMAATVVHLFHDDQEVSRWMTEKFLGDFRRFEGRELAEYQELISVQSLELEGFSDEAVGLRTVQTTPTGLASSTIADFRVGRLLGVAYAVTLGDHERAPLVTRIGQELERRMVSVALGVP